MSYQIRSGDTLGAIAARYGTTVSALQRANGLRGTMIYAGRQLTIPGQGGGGGGGGGGAAPAAPAAPNYVDAAIAAYGPVAQIYNSVPDIQPLLVQAVQNQWSADRLTAAVQATPWYQQHSYSYRQLFATQKSDPAEYQQQLNRATQLVQETAGSMGHTVDAGSLAYRYLAEGWTTADLQAAIGGGTITLNTNGAYAGDAGRIQTHLEQVAASYGTPITRDSVSWWTNRIQSGQDTLDGFDAAIKGQAKSMFPQYATQFDQGQTLQQIADPYMAQMAKTLEVPQSSVTLNDPYIQKALSVRDPQSGAVTSQSMWQFTQNLKADPRYDKTEQAKTDAYATLAKIGADFGFNGGTGGNAR